MIDFCDYEGFVFVLSYFELIYLEVVDFDDGCRVFVFCVIGIRW